MRVDGSVQSPKVPSLGPDHMAFGTWKSAIPHAPCELCNIIINSAGLERPRRTPVLGAPCCLLFAHMLGETRYTHDVAQVSTRPRTKQVTPQSAPDHECPIFPPKHSALGCQLNTTDTQLNLGDSNLPFWLAQTMWGL